MKSILHVIDRRLVNTVQPINQLEDYILKITVSNSKIKKEFFRNEDETWKMAAI